MMNEDVRTEHKIWLPRWLVRFFAPRLAEDLERRSAMTGEARYTTREIPLLFGLLTIQVTTVCHNEEADSQ